MKKLFFISFYIGFVGHTIAQPTGEKLKTAFQQFEKDAQLKHAISSLYVIDGKNGKPVFDKNSQIGLAPASTQKIITSVTAFELLGKEYRFATELGYQGKIENNSLDGSLFIIGYGDPTFGSWRWEQTKPERIITSFVKAIESARIKFIRNSYEFGTLHFPDQYIQDSWIWQDVGNYYGAGFSAINWKENQFDIILKSDKEIGRLVDVDQEASNLNGYTVRSEARSGPRGSGDNAYAYLPVGNSNQVVVLGTIPADEKRFKISATNPDPVNEFFKQFSDSLSTKKIKFGFEKGKSAFYSNGVELKKYPASEIIYTHYSPSLDSIIYWLNKKSINLYAEALIKTFAYQKNGIGSTDRGIGIVKDFWKQKGLDEDELNISDGSGLSPQNRITTHAQVEILKYAKARDWFSYFYNSLPEYNGMTMKSGTIKDVKGFCGYHKAKDGKEYIFSFLVNNYNGPSSGLVSKMYKVLDVLK